MIIERYNEKKKEFLTLITRLNYNSSDKKASIKLKLKGNLNKIIKTYV